MEQEPSQPVLARRGVLAGATALGIATTILPLATAAASTDPPSLLSCTDVPFLAEGASTTIGGITVTAESNDDVSGAAFVADTYLHASDGGSLTVLTFSPPIDGVELTTHFHDDGAGVGVSEIYTITGETSGGAQLFSETLQNVDTTISRPASGSFAPGLTRLRIAYSAAGTPSNRYASIIGIRIPVC